MIYQLPTIDSDLDQGDLLDDCPVAAVRSFSLDKPDAAQLHLDFQRAMVLTQACDLANKKTDVVVVASVFQAQLLIDRRILKPADIKGPLRSGRIWGHYFLPADATLGLNEMIVEMHRLHTVRLDLLQSLCRTGKRRARLQTPYREHLAKHVADTFSRIDLPRPYETL